MHAPTQTITRDNLERSYTRAIFFNFSSIESSIATFKTNCIQHKKCRHYPWPGLFFFMILSEQRKRVDNSYWIIDTKNNLIKWFLQFFLMIEARYNYLGYFILQGLFTKWVKLISNEKWLVIGFNRFSQMSL